MIRSAVLCALLGRVSKAKRKMPCGTANVLFKTVPYPYISFQMSKSLIFAALLSAVVLSACGKKEEAAAPAPAPVAAPAPAEAAAAPAAPAADAAAPAAAPAADAAAAPAAAPAATEAPKQ
jgi:hypothetical protein